MGQSFNNYLAVVASHSCTFKSIFSLVRQNNQTNKANKLVIL